MLQRPRHLLASMSVHLLITGSPAGKHSQDCARRPRCAGGRPRRGRRRRARSGKRPRQRQPLYHAPSNRQCTDLQQFRSGMSWEDYGATGWHGDLKRSMADLEDLTG